MTVGQSSISSRRKGICFQKDTYRSTIHQSTISITTPASQAKVTCRKPTRHKFLALGNGKQLRPNLGGRGLLFKDEGSHKHFIHSFGVQCFQKSQNSWKITLMVMGCQISESLSWLHLCTLDGTRSCSQIHIKLPGEVILTFDTLVFHPNDVKLPGRCREPPYDRCHKDRWVARWGFEG